MLQQISVLGCSIAYLVSVIGCYLYNKNNHNTLLPVGSVYCALFSCMLFVFSCIRNFYLNGFTAFTIFSCILCFGLCMYVRRKALRAYQKIKNDLPQREIHSESNRAVIFAEKIQVKAITVSVFPCFCFE